MNSIELQFFHHLNWSGGGSYNNFTRLGYRNIQLNRTNRLLYARIGKIRTIYLLIRSKSIGESKMLPP